MNVDQGESVETEVESAVEESSQEVMETETVETQEEAPSEKKAAKPKKPKKPAVKKAAKVDEEVAVEEAPVAKKAATKKATAAKKTTTPTKKASDKPDKAVEKVGEAKKRAVVKDGVKSLSKAQVSILRVLQKYGPLVGQEIAKRANVNSTMIGNQAGYRNEEINERPVHQWNLMNRKYVKLLVPDEDSNQYRYMITPLGVKALAKE